jgi:hypothetical protein
MYRMTVENTIETGLERIAQAIEELCEKVGAAPAAAPAKRTRKKKAEVLSPAVPAPVTDPAAPVTEALPEADLALDPAIDPAPATIPAAAAVPIDPTGAEHTEEDVRGAAAPLVKASGAGNRAGYEAAQAIIVKYGASIADVPAAHRATVITELNTAFNNWGL